ncbi:MAG: hypothetical protein FD123_1384 [Bacteroidetes bacterium]|nr:MAG: hypothetical protein FD123_1384 [Bacteroidota bacterium]
MIRILLLSCFFSFSLAAQNNMQSFRGLSAPEKRWVIFHPFIAKKAHRISLHARAVTDSLAKAKALDGDAAGGQLDAFRHVYWMALLTKKTSARKARKLGKAHEKGNYLAFKKGAVEDGAQPDSASMIMDLKNNEYGISWGKRAGKYDGVRHVFPDVSTRRTIYFIETGEAWIISKDAEGYVLDCDGNRVDMEKWKGKWDIPKCVVKSNSLRR